MVTGLENRDSLIKVKGQDEYEAPKKEKKKRFRMEIKAVVNKVTRPDTRHKMRLARVFP